jgi:cation diffusion facilitator CzcD-associated flavoprotein CzcO
LRELPNHLATHTYFLSDYNDFRGKEVAVIGGGASAIESGALIHEAGGSAQLFVREAEAKFATRTPEVRPFIERIREPLTVMGSGRKHLVLQHLPLIIHFLPEPRRIPFVKHYLGPSAPWWIKDRVIGKVPIHVRSEIISALVVGDRVRFTVRDDRHLVRELEVDRVIAGTGYTAELARLPFVSGAMAKAQASAKGWSEALFDVP